MKTDNELIAAFMGWEKAKTGYMVPNLYPFTGYSTGETECTDTQMEFHHRWDWLMPVVEKIARFSFEEIKSNNGYKDIVENDYAYPRTFAMINNSGKFMVRVNRMTLHEDENLIDATYAAVVEFIKWHNGKGLIE